MDPAIEEAARRQSELEAAKAAFFASGGGIERIPIGRGQYSVDAKPPEVKYGRKAPVKRVRPPVAPSRREKQPVKLDEENALVAKIRDCMEQKLSRFRAAKDLGISSTLMTRLIKDHQIPYPVVTY